MLEAARVVRDFVRRAAGWSSADVMVGVGARGFVFAFNLAPGSGWTEIAYGHDLAAVRDAAWEAMGRVVSAMTPGAGRA
jgi:hypothetical protein